jgi:hypothetical protein
MKKIVLTGAVTALLMACNQAGESTENKQDSLDSVAREEKQMIDSAAEQRKDRVDSLTQEQKDSLERIDSMRRSDTARPR